MIAVVVLPDSFVFADNNLDESKAIEKIELLGGQVTRDEDLPARPVVGVATHGGNRFNDKYVHLLKSFVELTTLDLEQTQSTDVGLKEIQYLKKLTTLVSKPENRAMSDRLPNSTSRTLFRTISYAFSI